MRNSKNPHQTGYRRMIDRRDRKVKSGRSFCRARQNRAVQSIISPQCSARLRLDFSWVLKRMDSEASSFQSGLTPIVLANVPPRHPTAMPAGAIIAWTPSRMISAAACWLMEETQLPASLAVTSQKRRA
jgi:hypothetical protein